jgi:tRNA (guanine-N7-)-methyltransferase
VIRPTWVSTAAGTVKLAAHDAPLTLDRLVPGDGAWEVEVGYGKGKYLLDRAAAEPHRRFLGIEMVGQYEKLMVRRARRRGLANWASLRGEALYLLSAVLPAAFADVLHVYFPDPWPKAKHHKRRLFDPETVDLVLGLVRPGGRFCFATDFLDYGELVCEILDAQPAVTYERRGEPWPDGARTHYEAKYVEEGRPILRLEGRVSPTPTVISPGASHLGEGLLHPAAREAVLCGWAESARAE